MIFCNYLQDIYRIEQFIAQLYEIAYLFCYIFATSFKLIFLNFLIISNIFSLINFVYSVIHQFMMLILYVQCKHGKTLNSNCNYALILFLEIKQNAKSIYKFMFIFHLKDYLVKYVHEFLIHDFFECWYFTLIISCHLFVYEDLLLYFQP